MGYFMARIFLFLYMIGVDVKKFRFRQHMKNEMAHYARDCWDAECRTSYGWVECVGCADRSCFDLTQHTKATGARLVAEKPLAAPKKVRKVQCVPNKGKIGKTYRAEAAGILTALSELGPEATAKLKTELETSGKSNLTVNGNQFEISADMVVVKEVEEIVHGELPLKPLIHLLLCVLLFISTLAFFVNLRMFSDRGRRTFLVYILLRKAYGL
ncbi:unnamed protein product [Dibothriocephalus latus]|uniref:Uncharacterized protein n=1 Tax=Dibothriocephalus latus TaxID=60516 RepID=A0A3P7NH27_DIBLA|nr:unnamed protein product [Dibothriocephalus latus]